MKDFFYFFLFYIYIYIYIYIYMHGDGVTAATNPYDNLCILLCICYSCWCSFWFVM
ncbi:hypothetical protein ACOSQ4_030051 [Xanthoceras sorbifolium]